MSCLHLDVGEGEVVRIGDATVTMERKNGKKARFRIDADKSIKIELIKNPGKSEENNTDTRMSATDIMVNTHGKNYCRA